MSMLNEIKAKVRNEIHDGHRDINTIKCKGYKNVEQANVDRDRNREVAEWILGNKVHVISGGTEQRLRGLLLPDTAAGTTIRQTLQEFDHMVP